MQDVLDGGAVCSKQVKFRDSGTRRNNLPSIPKKAYSPGVIKVRDNLHLQQACTGIVPINSHDTLRRVLTDTSPRLPYRRRRGEMKSLVHWGQRKLILSEIEFLTNHSNGRATCVYVGAAPGNHINYLSQLFPEVYFICIDPKEFGCWEDPGHVFLRQELMTDDIARTFKSYSRDEPLLFISDIRSADWRNIPETALTEEILSDMRLQKQWHDLMCPSASLLKFRLPWQSGSTEYLAGQLYLPVWAPVTSTEARLVVTSADGMRSWDHKQYWEQMFYFNTVTRASAYIHIMTSSPSPNLGILVNTDRQCEDGTRYMQHDNCYDCAAEVEILSSYVVWSGESEGEAVGVPVEAVTRISRGIDMACSVGCAGGRHRRRHQLEENHLPLSFSSRSRISLSRGGWRRRDKREWVEHSDPPRPPVLAAALHVTSKCSQDILVDCLHCTCPRLAPVRADGDSLSQLNRQCGVSSCSTWLLCMRDPDMIDLPHTDPGAWSPLGLGCEVPDECALSIWLWVVLLQITGRTSTAHAIQQRVLSLPATTLEDRTAALEFCLQSESVERVLQQFSPYNTCPMHPVVVLFGVSGYVYMYFMDRSCGAEDIPSLARLNVNSGTDAGGFGVCSGVVIRGKDGLLSIVLSRVIAWVVDGQTVPPDSIDSQIKDSSDCCKICQRVIGALDIKESGRLMMWRSIGVNSVLCSHNLNIEEFITLDSCHSKYT